MTRGPSPTIRAFLLAIAYSVPPSGGVSRPEEESTEPVRTAPNSPVRTSRHAGVVPLLLSVCVALAFAASAEASEAPTPRDKLITYMRLYEKAAVKHLSSYWFTFEGGHTVLVDGRNIVRGAQLYVYTSLLDWAASARAATSLCRGVRTAVRDLGLSDVAKIVVWSRVAGSSSGILVSDPPSLYDLAGTSC